jgi:hypothetical protein
MTRPFFNFIEELFNYYEWDRPRGPCVLLTVGASHSLNFLDDFLPARAHAPRLLLTSYLCGLAVLLARRSVYRCHLDAMHSSPFVSLLFACLYNVLGSLSSSFLDQALYI